MPSSVSPATTNAGPTFSYPHAADHPGWLVIGHPAAGHPGWLVIGHPAAGQRGWLVIGHPAAGHPGWLVIGHPAAGHPGWLVIGHPAAGQRGRPPWQATRKGWPYYTRGTREPRSAVGRRTYIVGPPLAGGLPGWPAAGWPMTSQPDWSAALACRAGLPTGLPQRGLGARVG